MIIYVILIMIIYLIVLIISDDVLEYLILIKFYINIQILSELGILIIVRNEICLIIIWINKRAITGRNGDPTHVKLKYISNFRTK